MPVGTSSSGGVLVEVPETILRGFKVKLVALGSLEAVWTSRGTKSRDQVLPAVQHACRFVLRPADRMCCPAGVKSNCLREALTKSHDSYRALLVIA